MARREWEKGSLIMANSKDARIFAEATSLLLRTSNSIHTDIQVAEVMSKLGVDLERREALRLREKILLAMDQLEHSVSMLNECIGNTIITGGKPIDGE